MSSTMAVKVAHPASFDTMTDLYAIQEHPLDRFHGQARRQSTRTTATRPSTAGAVYPMYSGLQMQIGDRARSTDSPPLILNRPRKLSNQYNASGSNHYSRDSMTSGARASSWGSRSSLDSADFETRRPGRLHHQLSKPKERRAGAIPDEVFAALPDEVVELIFDNLRSLHLKKGSDSCATCWMRDICNISLSSRKCSRIARTLLYEDIQLVGSDSANHKKKFKLSQGSRLILLRRTLRANPYIAGVVRQLKIPRPEPAMLGSNAKAMSGLEQYEDRVAALVMACPNLERLVGPTSSYNHLSKKLFRALSSRTKLKSMDWLIGASTFQSEHRTNSDNQQSGPITSGELHPFEQSAFLDLHRNWADLTLLTIHCLPNATLAPSHLLTRVINLLPSLQDLYLCNIPSKAFNDKTLVSLPRLRNLSLSHIAGITSGGLSSFATLSNSQPLQGLHLQHTPLASLPALARVFSNLRSLTSFSLSQSFPPLMPETNSFMLWMMPYLASAGIEMLHWDITSQTASTNAADSILAQSIAAGGFPALRKLRTPNDPEGVFQALCRPVEKIDRPSDRFLPKNETGALSHSAPGSPTKGLQKSSTTNSLPSVFSKPSAVGTHLVVARLAAQTRLEDARKASRFQVNVTEDDDLVETFGLGGYIGTVGSEIEYYLHPDEGATDAKSGLLDPRDLNNESAEGPRDGCVGRWNWREGVVADKKERERWWHTERDRWTDVRLL